MLARLRAGIGASGRRAGAVPPNLLREHADVDRLAEHPGESGLQQPFLASDI
jgi:hypothetical protein